MFKLTLTKKRWLWAYLFMSIPLLFFIIIRIYPTLSSFRLSFFDANPLAEQDYFIGFDNYKRAFKEIFTPGHITNMAFKNTFKYVLIGMPVQIGLGLIAALMLKEIKKFQTLIRGMFFLPFITSTVAVSWVFRWLYSLPYGPINVFLINAGLKPQKFLNNPRQALYAVLAVTIWQGLGYCVIIFLAGLNQIPKVYYEAAEIDGANRLQSFWNITMPLLNNSLVYLIVLQTISFLRMFGPILAMTTNGEGGPINSTVSVVLRIYREGFSRLDMGYSSALSVILFIIIMTVTLVQMAVTQRNEE